MHGVLVTVTIDPARRDDSTQVLHDVIVPRVKGTPGFVSGTWLRSADATRGHGVLLFESEETARAAGEQAATGQPPGSPVTFVSADVFEVIAQA